MQQFWDQIRTAGLIGLPFSITLTGEVSGTTGLTDTQVAALHTIIAAYDWTAPAPPPPLTYAQFRALFTAAENQAIMTAAQNNHAVLDWLLQSAGAGSIDTAAAKSGLNMLVEARVLTEDRVPAILARKAPS